MHEPLFQRIHLTENKSFNILKVDRPHFVVPWHFHPEVEIMLVLKGKGTRFVGDSIEHFEALDLVMVGANLAHAWKNSEVHYLEHSEYTAEARVILFREDCFGNNFFSVPELNAISDLLNRASKGICFEGRNRETIAGLIVDAFNKQGAEQFISLIGILHKLSITQTCRYLCSAGYRQNVLATDLVRLNSVIDFLMKNFQKPVRLQEAADIANMSATAFCRYFKGRTHKTVIQFINELRIGYAHKLLLEKSLNVDQVCYECGFNNVSNFYEQFEKITGKSPHKFRKEHNEKALIVS